MIRPRLSALTAWAVQVVITATQLCRNWRRTQLRYLPAVAGFTLTLATLILPGPVAAQGSNTSNGTGGWVNGNYSSGSGGSGGTSGGLLQGFTEAIIDATGLLVEAAATVFYGAFIFALEFVLSGLATPLPDAAPNYIRDSGETIFHPVFNSLTPIQDYFVTLGFFAALLGLLVYFVAIGVSESAYSNRTQILGRFLIAFVGLAVVPTAVGFLLEIVDAVRLAIIPEDIALAQRIGNSLVEQLNESYADGTIGGLFGAIGSAVVVNSVTGILLPIFNGVIGLALALVAGALAIFIFIRTIAVFTLWAGAPLLIALWPVKDGPLGALYRPVKQALGLCLSYTLAVIPIALVVRVGLLVTEVGVNSFPLVGSFLGIATFTAAIYVGIRTINATGQFIKAGEKLGVTVAALGAVGLAGGSITAAARGFAYRGPKAGAVTSAAELGQVGYEKYQNEGLPDTLENLKSKVGSEFGYGTDNDEADTEADGTETAGPEPNSDTDDTSDEPEETPPEPDADDTEDDEDAETTTTETDRSDATDKTETRTREDDFWNQDESVDSDAEADTRPSPSEVTPDDGGFVPTTPSDKTAATPASRSSTRLSVGASSPTTDGADTEVEAEADSGDADEGAVPEEFEDPEIGPFPDEEGEGVRYDMANGVAGETDDEESIRDAVEDNNGVVAEVNADGSATLRGDDSTVQRISDELEGEGYELSEDDAGNPVVEDLDEEAMGVISGPTRGDTAVGVVESDDRKAARESRREAQARKNRSLGLPNGTSEVFDERLPDGQQTVDDEEALERVEDTGAVATVQPDGTTELNGTPNAIDSAEEFLREETDADVTRVSDDELAVEGLNPAAESKGDDPTEIFERLSEATGDGSPLQLRPQQAVTDDTATGELVETAVGSDRVLDEDTGLILDGDAEPDTSTTTVTDRKTIEDGDAPVATLTDDGAGKIEGDREQIEQIKSNIASADQDIAVTELSDTALRVEEFNSDVAGAITGESAPEPTDLGVVDERSPPPTARFEDGGVIQSRAEFSEAQQAARQAGDETLQTRLENPTDSFLLDLSEFDDDVAESIVPETAPKSDKLGGYVLTGSELGTVATQLDDKVDNPRVSTTPKASARIEQEADDVELSRESETVTVAVGSVSSGRGPDKALQGAIAPQNPNERVDVTVGDTGSIRQMDVRSGIDETKAQITGYTRTQRDDETGEVYTEQDGFALDLSGVNPGKVDNVRSEIQELSGVKPVNAAGKEVSVDEALEFKIDPEETSVPVVENLLRSQQDPVSYQVDALAGQQADATSYATQSAVKTLTVPKGDPTEQEIVLTPTESGAVDAQVASGEPTERIQTQIDPDTGRVILDGSSGVDSDTFAETVKPVVSEERYEDLKAGNGFNMVEIEDRGMAQIAVERATNQVGTQLNIDDAQALGLTQPQQGAADRTLQLTAESINTPANVESVTLDGTTEGQPTVSFHDSADNSSWDIAVSQGEQARDLTVHAPADRETEMVKALGTDVIDSPPEDAGNGTVKATIKDATEADLQKVMARGSGSSKNVSVKREAFETVGKDITDMQTVLETGANSGLFVRSKDGTTSVRAVENGEETINSDPTVDPEARVSFDKAVEPGDSKEITIDIENEEKIDRITQELQDRAREARTVNKDGTQINTTATPQAVLDALSGAGVNTYAPADVASEMPGIYEVSPEEASYDKRQTGANARGWMLEDVTLDDIERDENNS